MRTYLRNQNVDHNIAVVLKMLCAVRGVTLAKLAADHGMSPSAIHERMSGKRRFTAAEVSAFAQYLDVKPGRFFEPAISESEFACTGTGAGRHLYLVAA